MFFNRPNINTEFEEYNNTPGAILMDVREKDEYTGGHIPGAVNIPLSSIQTAELPAEKDAPIYVYCLSGARSRRAVSFLQSAGFTNVKNIGGINSYKGKMVK